MARGGVLAIVLGSAGLCAAVVPGVFTIDEPAHLAMVASLRQGRLSPGGLDGVTPTPELAFYSPHVGRERRGLPVHELPPLYAVMALPFSALGVAGLFYLNVLAFVGSALLLFYFTRSQASSAASPWLALVAFALGSHSIEYALGLWPHMLSVLLCTGGFVLASRSRSTDSLRAAAMAGVVLGLACGVRYPNIVYAAAVGLGLLLWAPRRWEGGVSFGLGMAGPLAASALINGARLGSYNPISKGTGYLRVAPATPTLDSGIESASPVGAFVEGPVGDALRAFWFRVVDYSARPAASFPGFDLRLDADSGAYLWYDVVKKAWLQSSPWVLVSLCVLALSFRSSATQARDAVGVDATPLDEGASPRLAVHAGHRVELRAAALVVLAVLSLFTLAGSSRTDGMCFNQRYLLDLVPLAAFALALGVERLQLPRAALAIGGLVGGGTALLALHGLESTASQRLVLYAPLALALALCAAWLMAAKPGGAAATGALMGACLAWAAGIHLASDVAVSRTHRREVAVLSKLSEPQLPDHSAVLVWGIHRGIVAPLQLDRDLVIADATRGGGRGTLRLTAELMQRGRRVFILANGFERSLRLRLSERFGVRRVLSGKLTLMELGAPR